MAWCLIKSEATKFKKALKDGTIDPVKLSKMSSEQRREFFSNVVSPSNAQRVNALFESKLLLKNQQRGMITWAKSISGISKQAKRDIISRIERMDKILDPSEYNQFLSDLAAQRLGVGVTEEEANTINELSKKIRKNKEKMNDDYTFNNETDRLELGRSKVALANYVNDLKLQANKTGLKEKIKNPVKTLSDIAGNSKSIKASMDNSAIFRQGWKAMWTNPGIWFKNAAKSFKDIGRTFGKKAVLDELNADLTTRENYLNGKYKDMGLALGTIEEEFPGSILEKVPGIRGFYQASENAFTAFVYKTRADIADVYLKVAEASGVDLANKNELKSIGMMVNSLTGRGNLGRLEPAANVFNNVFFSPRKLKADIDTLTLHALDKNFSSFARKESAKNTLKIVAGTAAVLAIAKAIDPDSVEEDPRSADFGKIRVGNTRFDVTGGMGSIAVLAARMASGATKSSTTGKITKLNSGDFGSMTRKDVIYNFFENKLSPASAVVMDLLEGEDFDGNKITGKMVLKDLFVPLPVTNAYETLGEPDRANMLAIMLADGLGIGTNTYSPQSNWNASTSKTLTQFKDEVGEKKFKEANEKFNKRYNDWVNSVTKTDEYKSLSEENKKKLISQGKSDIQEQVLDEYGFKYERGKETKQEKQEKKTIDKLLPK